jgi:hypothetical protein
MTKTNETNQTIKVEEEDILQTVEILITSYTIATSYKWIDILNDLLIAFIKLYEKYNNIGACKKILKVCIKKQALIKLYLIYKGYLYDFDIEKDSLDIAKILSESKKSNKLTFKEWYEKKLEEKNQSEKEKLKDSKIFKEKYSKKIALLFKGLNESQIDILKGLLKMASEKEKEEK